MKSLWMSLSLITALSGCAEVKHVNSRACDHVYGTWLMGVVSIDTSAQACWPAGFAFNDIIGVSETNGAPSFVDREEEGNTGVTYSGSLVAGEDCAVNMDENIVFGDPSNGFTLQLNRVYTQVNSTAMLGAMFETESIAGSEPFQCSDVFAGGGVKFGVSQ